MAILPRIEKTPLQLAMECLNDEPNVSDKRGYLGMSAIGNPCHRALQFLHYGCVQVSHTSRVNRLFDDGHNAEPQLKAELRKIGIDTYSEQIELIGITGHIQGHIDGLGKFFDDKFKCIEGEFLVEYKTHNKDNFKSVKTKGVKASHPGHYDQVIMYMHHLNLTQTLYVAKCKDNSEIYLEIIDYDSEHFDTLQRRVIEVITADSLLPRIGNNNPTWFQCKLCDACDICFGREEPSKDCRNCQHVDVMDEGKWKCTLHNEFLDDTIHCSDYELGDIFKCIN